MSETILDTDNDILKMLIFDPESDAVKLKIEGKNPGIYRVTPIEQLDLNIGKCHPDHLDALLDARNYLYKKDGSGANEPTA